MTLFSSDPQVTLNSVIQINNLGFAENVVENEDLVACMEWIKEGGFKKVCLQFPDSLLVQSVDIALFIEKQISQKVYILGDTSYGSCCTDEITAQHVNGDAIVHFGHACLSPAIILPVYYIFPKAPLDVKHFYTTLIEKKLDGPILLLYDVSFYHKFDELNCLMPKELKNVLFISRLHVKQRPPNWSSLLQSESLRTSFYSRCTLSRLYNSPLEKKFKSVVYLGERKSANLINFLEIFKGTEFFSYSINKPEIEPIFASQIMVKCSYFVEKLKEATNIGILAATLAIKGHLEAIDHIQKLCNRFKKKTYVIVVGRPTPAKLANFPEVDIFVAIACSEFDIGDPKNYMQPIVSMLEVELAFNENRTWEDPFSKNFRDFLPDGCNYIPFPIGDPTEGQSVSLVSSKTKGNFCSSESTELEMKQEGQVVLKSNSYHRTWTGLERSLGNTEVTAPNQGRSGIPLGYQNEGLLKETKDVEK